MSSNSQNPYRKRHRLLTQRLRANLRRGNIRARPQRHVQNTRVQLHTRHDAVALVHVGILNPPQRRDGDEERALRPPAVHDEGAPPKHVEAEHGHHGRHHRRRVVHHRVDKRFVREADGAVKRRAVRGAKRHARELLERHDGAGNRRASQVALVEEVFPGRLFPPAHVALFAHGRDLELREAAVDVFLASHRAEDLEGFVGAVVEHEPAGRVGREPQQAQDQDGGEGLQRRGDLPARVVDLFGHGLVDDAGDEGAGGEAELDRTDEEAAKYTGGDFRLIRGDNLMIEPRLALPSENENAGTDKDKGKVIGMHLRSRRGQRQCRP